MTEHYVATYNTLKALTRLMARRLGMGHIHVYRLPPHLSTEYRGRAVGTTRIYYARTGAPFATVAHEVAHLRVSTNDHGPEWQAEYMQLLDVLAQIIEEVS